MRLRRRRVALPVPALLLVALLFPLLVLALVLPAALPAADGAAVTARAGAHRWAPAEGAAIRPGVQMVTKGAQCTGNFVFADHRGRVYVGYAAHCAGLGEATDTDGCGTGSHRLGTSVRFVRGGSAAGGGETVGWGRLAYSSWRAMRKRGENRTHVCRANDFALVRVNRPHVGKVNPTVPFWGGPTALGWHLPEGQQTYSYQQSGLRPTTLLSPKKGVSLGQTDRGWGIDVYTATPGVPGDSGSGFLDERGRAVGTLSTVYVAPVAGANGLGRLRPELRYAQRHSGIRGLRLVPGTEPFQPPA